MTLFGFHKISRRFVRFCVYRKRRARRETPQPSMVADIKIPSGMLLTDTVVASARPQTDPHQSPHSNNETPCILSARKSPLDGSRLPPRAKRRQIPFCRLGRWNYFMKYWNWIDCPAIVLWLRSPPLKDLFLGVIEKNLAATG